MNTIKIFTADDCKTNETGEYILQFTLPSTGQQLVITSVSPDSLVHFVNQQILSDLQWKDAEVAYREGVIRLLDIAMNQDGSGAVVAAQVLLSCYDCSTYQLETARLTALDTENLAHGINVINGRATCGKEPQELIPDGDSLFKRLSQRWQSLSLQSRCQT